jgi:hypothetical protein
MRRLERKSRLPGVNYLEADIELHTGQIAAVEARQLQQFHAKILGLLIMIRA